MNATLHTPAVISPNVRTAADLMVRNPVSIRATASIDEAMTLFVDKGIDAAPVIDDSGRPIGVISRSDVFIHLMEGARTLARAEEPAAAHRDADVAELMTPTIFAAELDTPVRRIIADMVGLHVHRLFVVDHFGALVGVITALDVLRFVEN